MRFVPHLKQSKQMPKVRKISNVLTPVPGIPQLQNESSIAKSEMFNRANHTESSADTFDLNEFFDFDDDWSIDRFCLHFEFSFGTAEYCFKTFSIDDSM